MSAIDGSRPCRCRCRHRTGGPRSRSEPPDECSPGSELDLRTRKVRTTNRVVVVVAVVVVVVAVVVVVVKDPQLQFGVNRN